jgi:hypothetical protein
LSELFPQGLMHAPFELDADYAEALWALDQPPGRIDFGVTVRDALASLEQLPRTSERFRKNLAPRAHPDLENLERLIRPSTVFLNSSAPKRLSTRVPRWRFVIAFSAGS